MVVVDGQGVPLGSQLTSASPAEVKLAEATLNTIAVPRGGRGRPQKRPLRVIADRAYDSDKLDEELRSEGVEMISPHRSNRKKRKTQDGRRLRRYDRRWIVERFFASTKTRDSGCSASGGIRRSPTTP